MPSSLDARAKQIIDALIDSSTDHEQAAIERACGGDRELTARVHELLAAIQREDEFLSNPAVDHPSGAEEPGTVIGRYRLLERLGEGGFGSVWAAEQREPVKRRVALKIIKLGMDTKQVIARFEAERQALALMEHPNIAQVLDAGSTETGRPYFVMELVKGVPILEYCDTGTLDTKSRLDLFTKVCHAIQHAHQKGVIHRDIKPSNVLVTMHDGVPVPKVIDFGIAKATSAELTAKTIYTQHRQMIGTPAYMSPEQAEMSGLDIDTRSDIYSLGVLLYELLTGTTPFTNDELMSKGFEEMMRIIREVEPHRPSLRLSSNGDTASSTAEQRRLDGPKLRSILEGDLDWIVMKCLEKDRQHRYESASGLAADIGRHLAGEPVAAAPPSVVYRVRKFVRRHRGRAVAACVVAVALVLGMIGTGLALRRALRAESSLREQLAQTQAAREAEKDRADELKKVSDFQQKMLAQVDPTAAGARLTEDVSRRFAAALQKDDVPEAERAGLVAAFRQNWVKVNATDAAAALIDETILKPAVTAIDEQFKDQPLVDARLREALANRYRDLGLNDAAAPLQTRALEVRRRLLGDEHPDTISSISNMGYLLASQGKLAEAEPYCREALEKSRRVLGEEHPDTLGSINNMGFLLQAQGKLELAYPYYLEAMQKRRRVLGREHPDTLESINNMGFLLKALGQLDEAEPYFREALEKRRRVLGEEHPLTLGSINNMGSLLQEQGKIALAEPYYREALEKRRRVLGEEHPGTISSINNMGFLLKSQGKLDEAEPYIREALEKGRRVLGEEHPDTLAYITNMGALLQAQNKLGEAEPYYREALAKNRRVLGDEHRNTLGCIGSLAILLQTEGRHAEALDLLAPIEATMRRPSIGTNAPLARFLATIARSRVALGGADHPESFALAEANLHEAYSIYARASAERHPEALRCAQGLVDLYAAWDKAQPGMGYDAKAAEWKAKLDSAPPTPGQK
jgi:tetratricopeptide (TPR) repeat protein/tRNA A-37 threonylcarbamoyl transferase component Bud32